MTAKEWIKYLLSHPEWTTTEIDWQAVGELETALSVLDIIVRKKADTGLLLALMKNDKWLDGGGIEEYNSIVTNQKKRLTKKEYEILKEALT